MEFGRLLKELRIKQGLSTHDLAKKSGVSQAYISQIERGAKTTPPKPDKIFKLHRHLGIGYSKLMRAAGYYVPDDSFNENELKVMESIEKGVPLVDLLKHKPLVDDIEITQTELEFAENVIRNYRKSVKKED